MLFKDRNKSDTDYASLREDMVKYQIARRGVKDKAVLEVILQVIQELSQNFDSEPESVFGEAAKDLLEQGPKTPWRDLVAGLAS